MGYRILVDENLDPGTADHLGDRDHDAVTVEAERERRVPRSLGTPVGTSGCS